MPDLPTGTVTFLFTDIEGSTRLLHELGAERYAQALDEHRRILRAAFTHHGGVEVDTQGDAFFIAFPSATAAAAAAEQAQAGLEGGSIRVRMGLHTGTAEVSGDGYVGSDVHVAARVAAAGHGRQILLSAQTRWLLDSLKLVTDLGEHRLRDIEQPVRLYQIGTEHFAPLKTATGSNLPRGVTSFVGRDREVAEVRRLFEAGARLVTLTGPGGTGKTRLAMEAALTLVESFRDGTHWVDLATLTDAALVSAAIGQVLGSRGELADHVANRRLLIVLDNLEHLVGAAPQLSELLSSCPNLHLMATSRELLRVRGEVEFAVPPLAADDAVELFCARADLEPDQTIRELCRRLDNLPLAVELAAARTRVLSPRQLLERIGARLDLLKGGRDADPRQQTLRATIDWSYGLLDGDEAALLARLGVFVGSFDVEAAEAVAAADIDTLQALVDKSLLRHEFERFVMLESIRAYANERLVERSEVERLVDAHAGYFLAQVKEAETALSSPGSEAWFDRLETDLGNLRAAMDWLQSSGRSQAALEMTGGLWSFWNHRGYVVEGISRISAALDADPGPTAARGKALNAISELIGWTGDHKLAMRYAAEALDIHRSIGDARGAGWSAWTLGLATAEDGSFEEARPLLEESVAALAAAGAQTEELAATRSLAWVYDELGQTDRARELVEQALRKSRELHNDEMEATFLGVLATKYTDEGRVEEALAMLTRSIALAQSLGDPVGVMVELTRAARTQAEAGQAVIAAQALARADLLREELGVSFERWNADMNSATLAVVQAALDPADSANAWAKGGSLTLDEALTLALTAVGTDESASAHG